MMFYRALISLILIFSTEVSVGQYVCEGTVSAVRDKLVPLADHPVYIYLEEELIDTIYTNNEGFYSFYCNEYFEQKIIIKTVGFCDEWQIYSDTILIGSDDVVGVNFEICHEDSDAACAVSFAYEALDSVTVNFVPNHNLDQLINYEWSFGDNQSISNLQNPDFQFSNEGVYTVTLVSTNPLGCSDTSIIEVLVSDDTFIRGQISILDNFFKDAYIQLISLEDNLVKETVYPDNFGNYEIWCNPDYYYLKVVPDLEPGYWPKVIPTYYEKTTKWNNAIAINDVHEIKEIDIEVLTSNYLSFGDNEVVVTLDADFNLDLLPIEVYLLDNELNPIDFGEKVGYGKYKIKDIPNGIFYIKPECPGRVASHSRVEFDWGNSDPVLTEFYVSSTAIYPVGINDLTHNDNRFDLYPVPVQNSLNLSSTYPIKEIRISDVNGKLVSTHSVEYNNRFRIPTDFWPKGVYFVTAFYDSQPPGCQKVVK